MSGELLWILNLLVFIGIYTLLAVSLNLINGYAGMFHLGHHGFWAMGAYGAAWLTIVGQGHMPGPPLFVASLLFAMLVAAVGGAHNRNPMPTTARRLPRDRHAWIW